MSIECELARVYVKWKGVDLIRTRMPTASDEASWEQELRKWLPIGTRLDEVCRFLTGDKFDSFLSKQSKLSASVQSRHPQSAICPPIKKFFEQHLFWKRNAIVHLGKIDLGQPDAEDCRRSAETLLQIISEMDFLRRQIFEASNP